MPSFALPSPPLLLATSKKSSLLGSAHLGLPSCMTKPVGQSQALHAQEMGAAMLFYGAQHQQGACAPSQRRCRRQASASPGLIKPARRASRKASNPGHLPATNAMGASTPQTKSTQAGLRAPLRGGCKAPPGGGGRSESWAAQRAQGPSPLCIAESVKMHDGEEEELLVSVRTWLHQTKRYDKHVGSKPRAVS